MSGRLRLRRILPAAVAACLLLPTATAVASGPFSSSGRFLGGQLQFRDASPANGSGNYRVAIDLRETLVRHWGGPWWCQHPLATTPVTWASTPCSGPEGLPGAGDYLVDNQPFALSSVANSGWAFRFDTLYFHVDQVDLATDWMEVTLVDGTTHTAYFAFIK